MIWQIQVENATKELKFTPKQQKAKPSNVS
jgi:hypothetical protein